MKRGKTLFFIGLALLIVGLALTIAGRTLQNKQNYESGVAAIADGDYQTAVDLLKPLGNVDYKDARALCEQAEAALGETSEAETDAAEDSPAEENTSENSATENNG